MSFLHLFAQLVEDLSRAALRNLLTNLDKTLVLASDHVVEPVVLAHDTLQLHLQLFDLLVSLVLLLVKVDVYQAICRFYDALITLRHVLSRVIVQSWRSRNGTE